MCQAGERKSRGGHGSDGNQVICIEERRVSIDLENKTSGGGFKLRGERQVQARRGAISQGKVETQMEEIITGKTMIRNYRDVRLNTNSQLTTVTARKK